MITADQYIAANKAGLDHIETGEFWSYYTPALQLAYNLGSERIDLSKAEIGTFFRYGEAPGYFISKNWATDTMEKGLSVYDENCVVRCEFLDRDRFEYTGIVTGSGSDGEPLILAFEAEYLD